MLIPVQFHVAAEIELGEAVSFYESRLAGLGTSFAAAVQGTVGFIRANPNAGSPLGAQLRKFAVRRFPYSVVYRCEEQRILILALAHHRRRPGYWKAHIAR